MKSLISFSVALLATVSMAFAQDSSTEPVKQGDPSVNQSSRQMQENMLKDMVKCTSDDLPEAVRKVMESSDFKGAKTYYKHKEKDEYAVEVRDGEVSSYFFYDKNGTPMNKRN